MALRRERRAWTREEDQLLYDAVVTEDPGSSVPSKWHDISVHVPGRSNKDCRKRWFSKLGSVGIVKGSWAPDEDERLKSAMEKYGPKWILIAAVVHTRNSDQCAKRWNDTLNPSIDRTNWSCEEDALLLEAVKKHGKLWSQIVKTYFPGRTGLSAKNRYHSISRTRVKFNRKPSIRCPSSRNNNGQPPLQSTSSAKPEITMTDPFILPDSSDLSGLASPMSTSDTLASPLCMSPSSSENSMSSPDGCFVSASVIDDLIDSPIISSYLTAVSFVEDSPKSLNTDASYLLSETLMKGLSSTPLVGGSCFDLDNFTSSTSIFSDLENAFGSQSFSPALFTSCGPPLKQSRPKNSHVVLQSGPSYVSSNPSSVDSEVFLRRQSTVLKLYGSAFCSATAHIQIVLNEKQVPYELIDVDAADKDFIRDKKFPLIDDDGFVVHDSRAACRYLATKYADRGSKLIPDAFNIKANALFDQALFNSVLNFEPYVLQVRYDRNVKRMKEIAPDKGIIQASSLIALLSILDSYETTLSQQRYLVGNEISLVDLYHLPWGEVLIEAGNNIFAKTGPNVSRWWKEISSRTSWQAIKKEKLFSVHQ
ncbi:hypothetical protein VKT23_013317 [Stygiomarasmius scandens]|uniref:Uncharacterized protein n=1 Tax=Marasmiellus scandens TaxID=2682957 RepID=A0ABR1J3F8_9AGAR